MELFSRSVGNSTGLHFDGADRKFPHHIPTLDVFGGLHALPNFAAVAVCS